MARALTVRACAKINWTLHVGARRDDGFHDVRTVLQSIAIEDTLVFSARRGPLLIECATPNVPTSSDNLVWRAATLFWRALGRAGEPRGLKIAIHKKIPVAAGLGGGSADAAAALVALNRVWDAGWTRAKLIHLAADLGSDVPFFLMGGTVLALGRGEQLYPLEDIRRQSLVIIKPPVDVRAADAYGWLDTDRAQRRADEPSAAPPASVDVGWRTGPLLGGNDLEPPVTRRRPVVREAIDGALRAGATMAAMSGSGSAVVAVFPAAAATRAATRLRRHQDWQVLVTRTLNRREACRAFPSGAV